jgi:hypothetical protein
MLSSENPPDWSMLQWHLDPESLRYRSRDTAERACRWLNSNEGPHDHWYYRPGSFVLVESCSNGVGSGAETERWACPRDLRKDSGDRWRDLASRFRPTGRVRLPVHNQTSHRSQVWQKADSAPEGRQERRRARVSCMS